MVCPTIGSVKGISFLSQVWSHFGNDLEIPFECKVCLTANDCEIMESFSLSAFNFYYYWSTSTNSLFLFSSVPTSKVSISTFKFLTRLKNSIIYNLLLVNLIVLWDQSYKLFILFPVGYFVLDQPRWWILRGILTIVFNVQTLFRALRCLKSHLHVQVFQSSNLFFN